MPDPKVLVADAVFHLFDATEQILILQKEFSRLLGEIIAHRRHNARQDVVAKMVA